MDLALAEHVLGDIIEPAVGIDHLSLAGRRGGVRGAKPSRDVLHHGPVGGQAVNGGNRNAVIGCDDAIAGIDI
jgi:hypothetical protein